MKRFIKKDLDPTDLEFVSGLENSQFTSCYWWACKTDSLGCAIRATNPEDYHVVEVVRGGRATHYLFDYDGKLAKVAPFVG